MSNEPQNIGQKLGIARPRIAFHELSSVGLLPKSLLRSVERAYLRRRQPWEEATTIKTLVPGLSPLWHRRSNCPAMAGAPGVWSYDSGPMRSDSHTKIDRGIVPYLAWCGARQLTRNPEMHFFRVDTPIHVMHLLPFRFIALSIAVPILRIRNMKAKHDTRRT
jgi:hypothetical protein